MSLTGNGQSPDARRFKAKLDDEQMDEVLDELMNYDTSPITIKSVSSTMSGGQKEMLSSSKLDDRLFDLQVKNNKKRLSKADIEEAHDLLVKAGVMSDLTQSKSSGKRNTQYTKTKTTSKTDTPKSNTFTKGKDGKFTGSKPAGIKEPTLKTKREVIAKDMSGNKVTIPQGEVITPYIDGAKVTITVGNKSYTIPKNQYQNLVGQSDRATATPFAPELKDTVETVLGVDEKQLLARKRAGEDVNVHTTSGTTKYSQYTLDGGENYREILIQAPASPKIKAQYIVENKPELKRPWVARFPHEAQHATSFETKAEADAWVKRMGEFDAPTEKEYRSSHWSEPNVISHIRMNERTVDGKKYAFMEELQSDWARDGRDKGFAAEIKPYTPDSLPAGWEIFERDGKFYLSDETGDVLSSGATKEATLASTNAKRTQAIGIPNNPLLKNWQIPTTKRALIEAVDSGADRFAWINGEQTSARYNLATHVEEVNWQKSEHPDFEDVDGIKEVTLKPKGGGLMTIDFDSTGKIVNNQYKAPDEWVGKKLDEVLGKGLADKIMEKETGTLSGDGLSFGGEWAKNLYDRQVRDIVKKLTGAEVKTVDMGLGTGAKKNGWLSTEKSGDYRGGSVTKGELTINDLKVGETIKNTSGDYYIITDVLGDGKFKAIDKYNYNKNYEVVLTPDNKDSAYGKYMFRDKAFANAPRRGVFFDSKAEAEAHMKQAIEESKETFDISTPTAVQQYIDLTPEVKAKIQSKAPNFKMKNPSAGESLPLLLLLLGGGAVASS